MSAILTHCPLVDISDCIISFIQYLFKTPDITPPEFRWSSDDRATKIFISGPYTVSRDKVGALPTVTVSRGDYGFENKGIDNLQTGSNNTLEQQGYQDLATGPISIICEAGTEAEATGLANFIALEIQANRHELASEAKFLHRILRVGISKTVPTKEEAEISRWQCNVNFTTSLYSGWIKRQLELTKLNKIGVKDGTEEWKSSYGEYIAHSDYFSDNSADFGFLSTNHPQLLQPEYLKKWYFILINGNAKPYTIEEIISNKTLRLSQVDENGNTVPFNPETTQTDVSYQLYWNAVHLSIEIK